MKYLNYIANGEFKTRFLVFIDIEKFTNKVYFVERLKRLNHKLIDDCNLWYFAWFGVLWNRGHQSMDGIGYCRCFLVNWAFISRTILKIEYFQSKFCFALILRRHIHGNLDFTITSVGSFSPSALAAVKLLRCFCSLVCSLNLFNVCIIIYKI